MHSSPNTTQAHDDTLGRVAVYSLYPNGVPGIMATSSCCPTISYDYT
jgi:hypothetical protein